MNPRLTGLFVHPVKSLRGCAVTEAEVDALGLVGDRRFLVVDPEGRFLTQRTLPRMALITTALTPDALQLAAPGMGPLRVDRASDPAAPWRRTPGGPGSAGRAAAAAGHESRSLAQALGLGVLP